MAIQAQLYRSNAGFPLCDNGYGTGGFIQSCFNSQIHQQQQQQQLEQRLRQLYNERQMFVDPNLFASNSKVSNNNNKDDNYHLSSNSPSFAFQFQKQWEEIDRYIRLQNDNLRFMAQQQKKQQVTALLKKVESDSHYILRKKEEEIAQANRKRVELEDFLRRLEAENQAWQKVAQENESMVLSLHKSLEEMRERAYYGFNNGVVGAGDAESCCDENKGNGVMEGEGIGENRVGCAGVEDVEQITKKMMICKGCNSRGSCFLLLPCRHLCSCKACEPFLKACPVCRMPKKASIETLIF